MSEAKFGIQNRIIIGGALTVIPLLLHWFWIEKGVVACRFSSSRPYVSHWSTNWAPHVSHCVDFILMKGLLHASSSVMSFLYIVVAHFKAEIALDHDKGYAFRLLVIALLRLRRIIPLRNLWHKQCMTSEH